MLFGWALLNSPVCFGIFCWKLLNLRLLYVIHLTIQNALQDFVPNIFDFEEHSYWQSQNLPYQCLQHSLKKVEVNGFVGRSNEMKMIQFLLENARVLEKMVISFIGRNAFAASTQQQQNNYMQLQNNSLQLLNFPRASSQAQIEIFGNPYNNTM